MKINKQNRTINLEKPSRALDGGKETFSSCNTSNCIIVLVRDTVARKWKMPSHMKSMEAFP